MTLSHVFYVAAGGAFGAVARYAVVSGVTVLFGHGFPLGTMVVNIVGSFLLGVIIEISALIWSPSPEIRAMIVVGVLGSFTTFSAFSLDVTMLWQRGDVWASIGYAVASVVLSIAAILIGMAMARAAIG